MQSGSLFKRPKASVLLTVVTTQTSGENDISPQGMASFPVEAVSTVLSKFKIGGMAVFTAL